MQTDAMLTRLGPSALTSPARSLCVKAVMRDRRAVGA